MATSSHPPRKDNIIAIPFPLHGHIMPMLYLLKKLAASGFSITFVNTERNHSMVARYLSLYPSMPNFHLLSLPDNLPPDFKFGSLPASSQFLQSVLGLRWAFENLMALQLTSTPPLCILSDVHVGWTQDIAHKFQLPRIALWTSNACECQVYFQAPSLISQGYLPFKGTSNDVIVPIPGLPPLHASEFPSFLQIEDAAHIAFSFFIDQLKRIPEADTVLINSFLELEKPVFDALKEEQIKVYPVGPLFLLEETSSEKPPLSDERGADTQRGLSSEEDCCFNWLDNQAANSVLYVAFGSIVSLTRAQIGSLAVGLERSQQPFLWALHSGTPGQPSDQLPEGFIDRSGNRGLVVAWAPQVRVLSHPSVGGFLTHCGWNSALEALSMGVPMICSPRKADQILTCKMLVDEWKVGLRFSESDWGLAKEGELPRLARELLVEEKGRDLRKRAEEISHAAIKAIGDGESLNSIRLLAQRLKEWQDA